MKDDLYRWKWRHDEEVEMRLLRHRSVHDTQTCWLIVLVRLISVTESNLESGLIHSMTDGVDPDCRVDVCRVSVAEDGFDEFPAAEATNFS